MTILSTAPVIDAAGIRAPSYGEVLQYFKDQYRNIYGADTYLEADSQDGQLLAVFAMAIHDANTAAVQVYNAFAGHGLGRGAVQQRQDQRPGARRGHALVGRSAHRGQSGTTIAGGVALDGDRVQWELPASVTIPPAGEITVTALCRQVGAAAPGSITRIGTPTLGWQSVTNPAAATPGAPVESDAACGSGKPCRWRCRRAPCWKARSARWRPCRACCATSPTRTTRPSRTPMACRRTASRWWWTAATQG